MTTSKYPLPKEDLEFLNGNKYNWEQVIEPETGKRGLIVHDYPIPDGYTPDSVDLMLVIPTDYPASKVDMFYFCPGVARIDGLAIGALCPEIHFGIEWQRWSRHYDWRVDEDNIAKHITYVGNQLKFELGK